MGTGENVLIGGFIITGNAPKKVILRAIGPSLSGVEEVLANPVLELHGPKGALIASNDNWKESQQAQIENTQIAPTNDFESAIVTTLSPGAYTAIVSGKDGTSGIALVEMYDLATNSSKLANISSRGLVQTGSDVMIAGFIFGNGAAREKVIIRALGPSLKGVANVLPDPTLSVHNGDGARLIANDNWKDNALQAAKIIATGLAPENDLESAAVINVSPGQYTAIIAGKDGVAGIGVAEVYHLN